MALFHRPLLLLFLLPLLDPGLGPLLSNAAKPHRHDPTTARSKEPGFYHATPPPPGSSSVSATAASPHAPLHPGRDVGYQELPQPQLQAERSASSTADRNDPAAATRTLHPRNSAPAGNRAHSVQDGAAGMVASDGEHRLQKLAWALSSFGYNEMASAMPLLANSPPLGTWPGPITVFAAPDIFVHASCPKCFLAHHLLEHTALGYYPYAELVAMDTSIPSASIGFCINVVSERGPFGMNYAQLYVEGTEVSHPDLYNDGFYVVHGLHGFVRRLTHTLCLDPRHKRTVDSTVTSASSSASSRPRVMIREAITRLREQGYGFTALAMRVKFAELERFANLTVFALEDRAIFMLGGHDYVAALGLHIVPGQRLTCADLLRLRPGTVLETLAGHGRKLVITHGSFHDIEKLRINYVAIKGPQIFVNSIVAVHSVFALFPVLDGRVFVSVENAEAARDETTGVSPAPATRDKLTPAPAPILAESNASGWLVLASAVPVLLMAFAFNGCRERWCKKRKKLIAVCHDCVVLPHRDAQWFASCCDLQLCSVCLAEGYLRRHMAVAPDRCNRQGTLSPIDGTGVETKRGFYLSSQVESDVEDKLGPSHLSDAALINEDDSKPEDKIRVKTFTSLSDVKNLRLPRRERFYYLIRPTDKEPLLLCKQTDVPTRRVFRDN